jgi:hypothetical protein
MQTNCNGIDLLLNDLKTRISGFPHTAVTLDLFFTIPYFIVSQISAGNVSKL